MDLSSKRLLPYIRGKSVLKLLKSMYGLRDAPKLWHQNLFHYLLDPELGFTQCTVDPCVLFRHDMIIIVYVDDMGVAAATDELIDELVEFLISSASDSLTYQTAQHI